MNFFITRCIRTLHIWCCLISMKGSDSELSTECGSATQPKELSQVRACCSPGEGQSRPVLSQAQSVFNYVEAFGVSVFLSLRFPPRIQVGSGAVEDVRYKTEKGKESQPIRPPGAPTIGSVIRIYREGEKIATRPLGSWCCPPLAFVLIQSTDHCLDSLECSCDQLPPFAKSVDNVDTKNNSSGARDRLALISLPSAHLVLCPEANSCHPWASSKSSLGTDLLPLLNLSSPKSKRKNISLPL